ncbi:hypothetical protein Trydic_g23597 [Trypoxylus dichotomus]
MASYSKSVRFGDSNFEETLPKRYEDVGREVSDIDEVSECDIESEDDTGSGFDVSEDAESNDEVAIVRNYYGRNRFKWMSELLIQKSKIQRDNIVSRLPSLRGKVNTSIQIWKCLSFDNIIERALKYANQSFSK